MTKVCPFPTYMSFFVVTGGICKALKLSIQWLVIQPLRNGASLYLDFNFIILLSYVNVGKITETEKKRKKSCIWCKQKNDVSFWILKGNYFDLYPFWCNEGQPTWWHQTIILGTWHTDNVNMLRSATSA